MNNFAKESKKDKFEDRLISLSRVSKTVKGGRRMSFSALVVVGDRSGSVGFGLGKAGEVPEAVRKAVAQARKSLITVQVENNTIPYAVFNKYGASKVFLLPANEGNGIVAGGAVRAISELAGIPNITSKVRGSRNPHNVVRAVFKALDGMMSRERYIALRRGPQTQASTEAPSTVQEA